MFSKSGLAVILLFLQVHFNIAVRCRLSIFISPLVAFMYLLWHQRPSISSSFSTTCLCRSALPWNTNIRWCICISEVIIMHNIFWILTGQTNEAAEMGIFQKQVESFGIGHHYSKLECIICVCQEDNIG